MTQRIKTMKYVLADSSSLILLQKVGLFDTFYRNYLLGIAHSVFRELTSVKKVGSTELLKLQGCIVKKRSTHCPVTGMDQGERDTIQLFFDGDADFVLVDDKKAARYCKANEIPFINSLLVPRILLENKIIGRDEYHEKSDRLIAVGYYSERIIERARDISSVELQRFFPSRSRGAEIRD